MGGHGFRVEIVESYEEGTDDLERYSRIEEPLETWVSSYG